MRIDLSCIEPAPTAVVSNLPYSIATPLILRTISELPRVVSWTVLVQREIADRLRAAPGIAHTARRACWSAPCESSYAARDRAVFRPRPRVDSALVRLTRRGPPAPPGLAALVRDAFAHRRKTLAGSLELAGGGSRERVRSALGAIGLPEDARAERLSPEDFVRLWEKLHS